jgi:hypothetical protein
MSEFLRDDLRGLLAQEAGLFVTLTMPISPSGSDGHQNTTRLKNLLREAEHMLSSLNRVDARTILEPAYNSLDSENLFQQNGLVMFLSADPDSFRHYHVESPLKETVVVADRVYMKPLLPLLTNNDTFYVLTLSQNQVHLLEGSPLSLRRIDVAELPASMDDALQLETAEHNTGGSPVRPSARTNAPGRKTGIGGEAASFAAHGAGKVDGEHHVEQYCQLVNRAVHNFLRDKTAPLMLVAVDDLHSVYRTANTYPHLMDEGISGNPASYDAKTIIDRARAIIEPVLKQKRAAVAGRYKELIHKKQASSIPVDVLKAAYQGQVDTLFVQDDTALWGTYNFDDGQLEVHREQQAGDADLLDVAATQTLLKDGAVYVVPADEMPDNSPIAALYRYTTWTAYKDSGRAG